LSVRAHVLLANLFPLLEEREHAPLVELVVDAPSYSWCVRAALLAIDAHRSPKPMHPEDAGRFSPSGPARPRASATSTI